MINWTDASSGYNSRISALESAGDSNFILAGSYSTWAKLYIPGNTPCSSGSKATGKLVINANSETFGGVSITIFDTSYFNKTWKPTDTIQFFSCNYYSIKIMSTGGYSIKILANSSYSGKVSNLNLANGTYLFSMTRL